MSCAPRVTSCSRRHGAVRGVLCCQDSTSKRLVIILYIIVKLFALRASSHCNHDTGALSWCAETFENTPTTFLNGPVKVLGALHCCVTTFCCFLNMRMALCMHWFRSAVNANIFADAHQYLQKIFQVL